MGALDMFGLGGPSDNQIYNDYGGRLRDYLLYRQDQNDPSKQTGYSHGWDEPHFQAMTAFQDLLNYSADRIPAHDALSVIQQTHPQVWDAVQNPQTMQSIRDSMGPSRLKGSTAHDILEPRTTPPMATGKYVRAGAPSDAVYSAVDNGGQIGIPTADQEALQAPYIDPVLTGTTGLAFGLTPMLASFTQQLVNNQLGVPRGLSQAMSMPVPNLVTLAEQGGRIGSAIDATAGNAMRSAMSNIFRTAGEGGMFEGMSAPEIKDMVRDILFTDEPSLKEMMSPDLARSVGERMQSLIQGISGIGPHAAKEAYAGEGLVRGVGLSALMQDLRNKYGMTAAQLGDTSQYTGPRDNAMLRGLQQ